MTAKQLPLQYPWLYYKARTGAIHQWRVWSEMETVFTEYGQVSGKMQRTPGKVCEATNVGAKNERDPIAQARFTAKAMHDFKLKRKYSLTPEEAEEQLRLPMLALKFEDKKKHIAWPADLQPKLDGNRCAARYENGKVVLVARSGVDYYELPHIASDVAKLMRTGDEFDGEVYCHGMHPNTVNSLVQDSSRPESKAIQFWIYDMPSVKGNDELPWSERRDVLVDRFAGAPSAGSLVLVPTITVTDEKQALHHLERHLGEGYEGAMLRNRDGLYAWGHRSPDLLKLKVWQDDEFKIIECNQGVGKMFGHAIFKVITKDGVKVDVTCAMPMAERKKQYEEREKYIGKMLTVKFFNYTPDGSLRFPRGIKFRLKADL